MTTNQATFGILAALGAPFFMAVGFIIWDKIWKTAGGSAFALNLFKCNLAALGFVAVSFILGWSTTEGENEDDIIFTFKSVGFLILSGFIGIIVGDLAWLEALRLLGATKVFLIDSLKPFSAALLGWLILGEAINPIAYSGIVLTIIGILVVSLEKEKRIDDGKEISSKSNFENSINSKDNDSVNEISESRLIVVEEHRTNDNNEIVSETERIHFVSRPRGFVFAVANVILDTYGSLLTKQHGGGMSTFAINLIRFGSSGLMMVAVTIFMSILKQNKRLELATDETPSTISSPWYLLPKLKSRAWMKVCIGVVFVTFLCPSLSNYALFQINLAFALTLGSITPFYALILEWPFYGKKPSPRALLGVCLTIGGVAILSVWRS